MQSISRTGSGGLSQQARRIATMAIVLFALSGLISGFAVGAFVKPKLGNTAQNTGNGNTTVAQKTKTPTPTPTIKPGKLGFPKVDEATYKEEANGKIIYIFSMHATRTDNITPLQTSGITCKLWLTKQQENPQRNEWSPVSALNNPIAGEIPGSLIFDQGTPQVQDCDANGHAMWKYQVSPSVNPGNYYLAVITDWAGVHYNIWWQLVVIKKAD